MGQLHELFSDYGRILVGNYEAQREPERNLVAERLEAIDAAVERDLSDWNAIHGACNADGVMITGELCKLLALAAPFRCEPRFPPGLARQIVHELFACVMVPLNKACANEIDEADLGGVA